MNKSTSRAYLAKRSMLTGGGGGGSGSGGGRGNNDGCSDDGGKSNGSSDGCEGKDCWVMTTATAEANATALAVVLVMMAAAVVLATQQRRKQSRGLMRQPLNMVVGRGASDRGKCVDCGLIMAAGEKGRDFSQRRKTTIYMNLELILALLAPLEVIDSILYYSYLCILSTMSSR